MEKYNERFWKRVNKGTPNECWEWQGASSEGYGISSHKGKHTRVHRIAFILSFGSIPDGMWVVHSCHNKICVNPKHLHIGDASSVTQKAFGEANGQSKLHERDILTIRKMIKGGISNYAIAKQFGVDPSAIWQIKNLRTWTHVPFFD
jgi:hypothetical protein